MYSSAATVSEKGTTDVIKEHIVRMAIATLILAATTEFKLYLPFSPIPISLHPLTIFLLGTAMGARNGVLAAAPYLLFKMFPGAPNAGYFAGMLVATGVMGVAADRNWTSSYRWTLLALVLADAIVLACGTLWLTTYVGQMRSVSLGLIPFLGGDLCKILLAAATIPRVCSIARRWSGSHA